MTNSKGAKLTQAEADDKAFELERARRHALFLVEQAAEELERHVDDELVLLKAHGVMQAELMAWELRLVTRLRDRAEPVTWAEIGEALGITKQGAIQRFSKLMPPRTYYSF